jgi:hypothetical protein
VSEFDRQQAAAKKLGLAYGEKGVDLTRASMLASMGGALGIVESITPGFLFLVLWTIFRDSALSAISACLVALGFIVFRLVSKKSATQAFVGAVGVGITAFMVLRDGGTAADYFVPGFITNAAYLTALLLSIVVRWPLVGLLVGALTGHITKWRADSGKLRVFTLATSLWVAMFTLRLVIQVPLYFADQIEALGIARLVMGLPLYALTTWITWLMVRRIVLDKNN